MTANFPNRYAGSVPVRPSRTAVSCFKSLRPKPLCRRPTVKAPPAGERGSKNEAHRSHRWADEFSARSTSAMCPRRAMPWLWIPWRSASRHRLRTLRHDGARRSDVGRAIDPTNGPATGGIDLPCPCDDLSTCWLWTRDRFQIPMDRRSRR